MRNNLDLSPFYRSMIGFDQFANLLDSANRNDKSNGYPPYNIELIDETHYRITMAVAGFTENELDIELEKNSLKVTGVKEEKSDKQYLYKGISERNFERRFQIAENIKVIAANISNGLLHIDLEREIPEQLKPTKIHINSLS